MAKVPTSITLDAEVKEKATALLSELGLDLSTAVGIFLRQTIREQGLPFEVTTRTPNAETIAAIEEFDEMIKDPSKYKRYGTIEDAIAEVLADA